jgi:hypothetical protein
MRRKALSVVEIEALHEFFTALLGCGIVANIRAIKAGKHIALTKQRETLWLPEIIHRTSS